MGVASDLDRDVDPRHGILRHQPEDVTNDRFVAHRSDRLGDSRENIGDPESRLLTRWKEPVGEALACALPQGVE
jgi:hypothetical protein